MRFHGYHRPIDITSRCRYRGFVRAGETSHGSVQSGLTLRVFMLRLLPASRLAHLLSSIVVAGALAGCSNGDETKLPGSETGEAADGDFDFSYDDADEDTIIDIHDGIEDDADQAA